MAKRFEKAKEYTAKYKSVLAPCKYCGNTEIIITSERSIFENKNLWAVTCITRSCDFAIDSNVKRAIQKWNERHAAQQGQKG